LYTGGFLIDIPFFLTYKYLKFMEVNMFTVKLLQEIEPNGDLGWLIYLVLFILLMMVIVGWLVSRRNASRPVVRGEAQVPPDIAAPDDLKRIEGIGPKVEELLNNAGIRTYQDLARADAANIQKKLDEAGLQMMDPKGWIEQAKLAARGEWEELKKLQDKLEGGRRT
jgi:hypothetical protein